MRQAFILLLIILSTAIKAQDIFEWDGNQLQFSDFQSPATSIDGGTIYSLHSGAGMDFQFHMTNAEFMFTKNFNSKVSCTFNRNAASLVAPDSVTANDLLQFARYGFDLSELYARKLRKRLYEEKGTFSDVNFFRPVYDEVQRELTERHTMAGKSADLGRNREKLQELHSNVLKEIEQLHDFCKKCKPLKKK